MYAGDFHFFLSPNIMLGDEIAAYVLKHHYFPRMTEGERLHIEHLREVGGPSPHPNFNF